MALRLHAAPENLPLTLAEVKARLRVEETTAFDAEISANLATAVQELDGRDGWLGRALEEQTWDLVLPRFPAACDQTGPDIIMPLPPLLEVVHVKYLDADLVERTLSTAAYVVTTAGEPARIVQASGYAWPGTGPHPEAVTVRFTCGYERAGSPPATTVPDPILQAITLRTKILLDDPAPDEAQRLQGLIDRLLVNLRGWSF